MKGWDSVGCGHRVPHASGSIPLHGKKLGVVENRIAQCCAAHIVQCCQQGCHNVVARNLQEGKSKFARLLPLVFFDIP